MRKKRTRPDSSNDTHRWVISYADFITLLFAFFVVMYAISSVNDSKYQSLSEGMHSAFNKKEKNKSHQENASSAKTHDRPAMQTKKADASDAFKGLQAAVQALGDGDFRVNGQDGWLEIDIQAGSLFTKGDAELKPEAIIKLMRVAGIIKDLPYPVALEGYTDNLPIQTPQYPSNWELSAARAAAVGRVLNNFGVASNRITVTGFGEQYPIADNQTVEGQSKNRRVNILIAKDRNNKRFLNPGINTPVQSFPFPLTFRTGS